MMSSLETFSKHEEEDFRVLLVQVGGSERPPLTVVLLSGAGGGGTGLYDDEG
jgi:hypothetical protein